MVAPIRYDWCSYHKRKDTRGGRARRDDVRRGNKTAAIRKSGREAFEEANPVTSRSRTSSLQNGETVHFCRSNIPVSDILPWRPELTEAEGEQE